MNFIEAVIKINQRKDLELCDYEPELTGEHLSICVYNNLKGPQFIGKLRWPQINLVIECDGDYWHKYPNGTELDEKRNIELEHAGYNVLRLWERDIKKMSEDILLNRIMEVV